MTQRTETGRLQGSATEVNFDGLVGPSHTFAGLATGNLAAAANTGRRAHPRAACLQGLAKMRRLAELGLTQAVLPPHERPHLATLRAMGFDGTDAEVVERAARTAPELFVGVTSASAMWVANAATVSPSVHTEDERLHLTPANLSAQFHRSIEAETTGRILRGVFGSIESCVVHDPLPSGGPSGDEGAANHTRLGAPGSVGLELFVHGDGESKGSRALREPRVHPARQSERSSRSVARRHRVEARSMHIRQHPEAIDAGVFHNDVIAVGHRHLLLVHELAWCDQAAVIAQIRERLGVLTVVEIPSELVGLDRAVSSYLFNSQLVTTPEGRVVMLGPSEIGDDPAMHVQVEELIVGSGAVDELVLLDLTESMGNGGGPACLRLRVELTDEELAAVAPGVIVDLDRIAILEEWAARHLREDLAVADLADPRFLEESRTALDELSTVLGLEGIYEFQR